jgi:hypothetical protein
VSNKSSLRTFAVLLFAVFATAALVFADLGVLAQNTNGSTTEGATQNDNSMGANTSMSHRRHGRRRARRRGRRRAAATADAAAAAGAAATDTGTGGTTTGNAGGEQTDLSGTYTGHVMMAGGHEMDGDGTLTITTNQFTLESGGMTHAGRVYAVTTRGYTGASFFFTDLTDSKTNTPVVAATRARKSGDHLMLMPVPGASTRMTFHAGGGGMGGGGRRGRRGGRRRGAPATTDATTTGDTTTTTPSAGDAAPTAGEATGTGEGTGTGTGTTTPRRRRRGRRGGATMNTNTNTNTNTGDNSNSTPPM